MPSLSNRGTYLTLPSSNRRCCCCCCACACAKLAYDDITGDDDTLAPSFGSTSALRTNDNAFVVDFRVVSCCFEASACDDVCLAGVREGLDNWRVSVTEVVSADSRLAKILVYVIYFYNFIFHAGYMYIHVLWFFCNFLHFLHLSIFL